MRRRSILLLALLAPIAGGPDCAQATNATPAAPFVRYHFGDDPDGAKGWASENFDDSAWPIAINGLLPAVAGRGDSFLWVRMHVRVPGNVQAPMALHLTGLGLQPTAWQAFVDGHAAGGQGLFPPHADPVEPPVSPVMELPPGFGQPVATALVALREWQAPTFFETGAPSRPAAVIDDARVLYQAVRASDAESVAENGPEFGLSILLFLVGIVLIFVWRSSRGPEYLWAAVFMVSPLLMATLSSSAVAARLSFHEQAAAWAAVYTSGLIAEIELMWTLFRLRSRALHIVWHTIWVAFILAEIGQAWFLAFPAIERLCRIVILAGVPAFDAILFTVCIRELFRAGGNRAFAVAMCLMEVVIGLAVFGYSVHVKLGPFTLDLFQHAVTVVQLAIAGLLIRRAVQAWREANTLRVEFDAAREVQQRLVTHPPTVPGFQIESVYLPAAQVGGDFYRIVPEEDGGILVVVGDVSGKGLPAAMTVSAIIGSLRTLSTSAPAEILRTLNRSLAGNLRGGFVTCLAARLHSDGSCTLANAGHLAPYVNGEELTIDSGFPLGLSSESTYAESAFRLPANTRLALITDGVVEARNPSGELFGFERTAAISAESAESIASAASTFGQEDDITVLTLTLEGLSATTA
jgi:hypothetical protein